MVLIGNMGLSLRAKTALAVVFSYAGLLVLDPFVTVLRLNVETWAARQKIDNLLPDADPDLGERIMSSGASIVSSVVGTITEFVNLAASPIGLSFALGGAFVVFAPPVLRALKTMPAIVQTVRQRRKNGFIPIRFLENSPYSFKKDGPIQGLPYMAGQVAGFEKGLACRLVESGITEYFWFWDKYFHRRYLWTTRGEPIALLRTAGEESNIAAPAPVGSAPSELATEINPLQLEFHKTRINLADLADPVTKVIANKTFYGCELIGPANVLPRGHLFLNNPNAVNCQAVVIKRDTRLFNVIVLEDCKIFGGKITNCTFFLVPEITAPFRQGSIRFLTPDEDDEPSPT